MTNGPLMKPLFVSLIWMGILAASHAPLSIAGRVAMGLALTLPLIAGWAFTFHADYWRQRDNWGSGWGPVHAGSTTTEEKP